MNCGHFRPVLGALFQPRLPRDIGPAAGDVHCGPLLAQRHARRDRPQQYVLAPFDILLP